MLTSTPLQKLYAGKKIYQDRVRDDRQAVWRAGTITVSSVTYPHLPGLNLSNTRAVLQALDAGVRRVVEALKTAGLYDNSILVFSTDNGGVAAGASNYPLRGTKEMLYEGNLMIHGDTHTDPGHLLQAESEAWASSTVLFSITR